VSNQILGNVSRGIQEEVHTTYITEVIQHDDVRANDPMMTDAKRKKIRGLLERGTFRIIMRSEIPAGANILGGIYVLSIKDSGTDREVWKARYVIQGHRDSEKEKMVKS
jgi:hypothetical protein